MTCLTDGITKLTESRESTNTVSGRAVFIARPVRSWPLSCRREMRLGNQTCHQKLRLWSNCRAFRFCSASVLPIRDQIPVSAPLPHNHEFEPHRGRLARSRPSAGPQRRIPLPMKLIFQNSPPRISAFSAVRAFQFALLLMVLSFGWNSIVPQALAATASVSIAATDSAAAESGATPTDTGTFAVSRPITAKNDGDATVDFSISGTAGNGTDYGLRLPDGSLIAAGATSGTVVILNGSATAVITVEPLDDTVPEDVESVTLTLTSVNLGYVIASSPNNAATVTIADNDTTVSIDATVANTAEGGLVPGIFTVTRTDSLGIPIAPSFPVTVNYSISGTAANGVDYSAIGTNVTIPAGLSSATATITPIDDALNEVNETVVLTLTAGSYNIAASPSNAATVTI